MISYIYESRLPSVRAIFVVVVHITKAMCLVLFATALNITSSVLGNSYHCFNSGINSISMARYMRALSYYFHILNSIISFITIDMVYDLCAEKFSAEMFFHNSSVNKKRFAFNISDQIASICHRWFTSFNQQFERIAVKSHSLIMLATQTMTPNRLSTILNRAYFSRYKFIPHNSSPFFNHYTFNFYTCQGECL